MPDHLQIRPAVIADADEIFGLLEQFAVSYRLERPLFDNHLPELLAAEEAELLVASVDGRVVGYTLAFRLLTLYANGPIMELQELMVDPPFRSRGIGRRLVEAIVERAWAGGCVEVTVPTRRAVDYYRKLGFIETATYLKRARTASTSI